MAGLHAHRGSGRPTQLAATWPTEEVSLFGGRCEWTSDYWTVTDGSEVYARSWHITVTAEGQVIGVSRYGPELLECPG